MRASLSDMKGLTTEFQIQRELNASIPDYRFQEDVNYNSSELSILYQDQIGSSIQTLDQGIVLLNNDNNRRQSLLTSYLEHSITNKVGELKLKDGFVVKTTFIPFMVICQEVMVEIMRKLDFSTMLIDQGVRLEVVYWNYKIFTDFEILKVKDISISSSLYAIIYPILGLSIVIFFIYSSINLPFIDLHIWYAHLQSYKLQEMFLFFGFIIQRTLDA